MVNKPRPIPIPLGTNRRQHLVDRSARQAEVERVDRIVGAGRRDDLAEVLGQDGAGGDALEGADADAFGAVGVQFDEGGGDGEGAGAGGVRVAG